MKRILILCFCSLVCSFSLFAQSVYTNPVIPGDFADPTVIRMGDTYYATGTSSEWAPFYPIFTSTDLVNWKQVGHIFDKQPEWTSNSFWAPEFYLHQDKVYMYYTARNKKGVSYIGVATADHPAGPYTDHGVIVEYGTEAIDAFILEDNGELFMSWKAYGLDKRPIELLAAKLSSDGLRLEGEPFSLMRDDERIGMEGQQWFKQGEYYYIIYSVLACCGPKSDYQVYVARSKDLRGPYEKYSGNPILYGDGGDILSCGHGTVTATPDGRMFYLCHAYLTGDRFYGGRQGILQEMEIGSDGWVHFKPGNKAQLQHPVPFKGTVQQSVANFEDDFTQSSLAVQWTWNYPFAAVTANINNGVLQLSGKPVADNPNGSVLCVRPVLPHYTYETKVVNKNNSLKGLTFYGDSKNFVAFGCSGDKLVIKEMKDGQETVREEAGSFPEGVYLKMEVTHGSQCSFFWAKEENKWNRFTGETAPRQYDFLVRWDRVARPGLIHSGSAGQPAEFSYFKLINR